MNRHFVVCIIIITLFLGCSMPEEEHPVDEHAELVSAENTIKFIQDSDYKIYNNLDCSKAIEFILPGLDSTAVLNFSGPVEISGNIISNGNIVIISSGDILISSEINAKSLAVITADDPDLLTDNFDLLVQYGFKIFKVFEYDAILDLL